MDLNKHTVGSNTVTPFHSNGFAVVASGSQIGSTANISFSQRQQIEQNRQAVGGYQRSAVGSIYGAMRSNPVRNVTNRTVDYQRPSLKQYNSGCNASRQFSEPAPRSFNPFS